MQMQVINKQPGPGVATIWMPLPQTIPGCPPGLEYLLQVDHLLCHQKVELLEAFTGWETNNKYAIKNGLGQQVYYAFEDTGCCMRWCCGANRAYVIHVVDNANREVLRLSREFKCCGGHTCCASIGCCAHESSVEAPVGVVIGRVRQTAACCALNFDIQDATGKPVLEIQGPCMPCRCCADIFTKDTGNGQQQVGCISKQWKGWSGLAREAFTDADHFAIKFPLDLDVHVKATLMGALFLIDFMAFEKSGNQNNNDGCIASCLS